MCTKRCLQQPHHRSYDATLLNKINLLLEDRCRIIIKFDDKTTLYLKPSPLQNFDAFDYITAFILRFAAFGKTFLIRRLNSNKYRILVSQNHKFNHFYSSVALIDASVPKGIPDLPFRHSIMAGSISVLMNFLFPMKLSSTKKIFLRHPSS